MSKEFLGFWGGKNQNLYRGPLALGLSENAKTKMFNIKETADSTITTSGLWVIHLNNETIDKTLDSV